MIKSTGIVRKIDNLGRVVIPREIRKTMDLENTDPVEFFVDEKDNIILHKYERSCYFCGSGDHLILYRDHPVCAACAKKLGDLSEKYSDD